jgi:hypothetical protein
MPSGKLCCEHCDTGVCDNKSEYVFFGTGFLRIIAGCAQNTVCNLDVI